MALPRCLRLDCFLRSVRRTKIHIAREREREELVYTIAALGLEIWRKAEQEFVGAPTPQARRNAKIRSPQTIGQHAQLSLGKSDLAEVGCPKTGGPSASPNEVEESEPALPWQWATLTCGESLSPCVQRLLQPACDAARGGRGGRRWPRRRGRRASPSEARRRIKRSPKQSMTIFAYTSTL